MINGYRVYEKDGHMYVDMSQDLTPVEKAIKEGIEEMFYITREALKNIAEEIRDVLTSIESERCGQHATTHS